MLGIYCCVISYLLTEVGWKLLSQEREVVQVARNSTILQLPQKLPAKLTFRDPLFSYLEIVVELPKIAAEHSLGLYNEIRDTFIMAIYKASNANASLWRENARTVLPMS